MSAVHRLSPGYPQRRRRPFWRRPFYSARYLDGRRSMRRLVWWALAAGALVDLVARYLTA